MLQSALHVALALNNPWYYELAYHIYKSSTVVIKARCYTPAWCGVDCAIFFSVCM